MSHPQSVANLPFLDRDLKDVNYNPKAYRWGFYLSKTLFFVFLLPMVTLSLAVSLDPIKPLYKRFLGSTMSCFLYESLVMFLGASILGVVLVYTRIVKVQNAYWNRLTKMDKIYLVLYYGVLLGFQALLLQYVMQYSGAFYSMYDQSFSARGSVQIDPTRSKASTMITKLMNYVGIITDRRIDNPTIEALAALAVHKRNIDRINSNLAYKYPADSNMTSQAQLNAEKAYVSDLSNLLDRSEGSVSEGFDDNKLRPPHSCILRKIRQYSFWLNWMPRFLCAIQSFGMGPLMALAIKKAVHCGTSGTKTSNHSVPVPEQAGVSKNKTSLMELLKNHEHAMECIRTTQVMVMNVTQGYQLLSMFGLFIAMTVGSIVVRDDHFVKKQKGLFALEVLTTFFTLGLPFMLMRYFRGGSLKECLWDGVFFGGCFAVFHIVMQYSGMLQYSYLQTPILDALKSRRPSPVMPPPPVVPPRSVPPTVEVRPMHAPVAVAPAATVPGTGVAPAAAAPSTL